MKHNLIVWLMLLTANFAVAQKNFDPNAKAQENIYLMKNGKVDALYERLDPIMKRYLDKEKLESIWDGLVMQFGEVKEIGSSRFDQKDTLFRTHTPITFEKKKISLLLVMDKKGKICGLFIEPVYPQYSPAAYTDPGKFYEYKKKLSDPKYPAEAVLAIPAKGKGLPLVIIVGGSGPTDKDLSMGPNKIYKDIAWGLASNGVACIRYDKRTVEHGEAMSKIKNLTVKEEYLDDLKLAIALAKKYPEIDSNRIYILGHSEGGYLIPYFEKNLKGIAAYISFAGSYSKLANLMCDQLKYLMDAAPKSQKGEYEELLSQAIYARDKSNKNTPDDSLPDGLTSIYLQHLNENGPEALIQFISNTKLLFIQGGRDYQVPPAEMDKWKAALKSNPRAEFELFPKINHLGLEGTGPSLPSEYDTPGNVPEEVINRILRFVLY